MNYAPSNRARPVIQSIRIYGLFVELPLGVSIASTVSPTLGALAVRLAPAGGPAIAARLAAISVFAFLAWKSDVWKDRGAIRHRPATPGSPAKGG